MKPTIRLTLDGLLRALRTRAETAADERIEAARKDAPKPDGEARDERRA